MKNGTFLFCFLLLTFHLTAQESISLESEIMDTRFFETDKIPIVKGKLLNYDSEKFKDLEIKYILVSIEERQVTKYTDVQLDGTFELNLPYAFPYQQIWLFIGEYYYGEIIAHEELLIKADLSKLKKKKVYFYGKGIEFKGKDGDLNKYFNQFVNFKRKEKQKYYKTFQSIMMDRETPTNERKQQYLTARKTWDNILQAYLQKYPSKYANLLKSESDGNFYAWFFSFYRGEDTTDKLLERALAYQPLMISNSGTSYYKYLTFLLKSLSPKATIAMLETVLSKKVKEVANQQKIASFLEQYQLRLEGKTYDKFIYDAGDSLFIEPNKGIIKAAKLASFLQKSEQLNKRKSDILKLCGMPYDKLDHQAYYEQVLPTLSTKWTVDIMKNQLQKAIVYNQGIHRTLATASNLTESSSLGKSLQSFPFGAKLYKAEVDEAETLLASIQNAFPDKAIILDVWATWCGPCIHDMKNSKDTKAALKELPVEVIYLCVEDGSSQKKWTKTIAELKTTGNHVFLEKKLAQSVMKYFDLRGYPSHIFIDKKGKWDTNFILSMSSLDIDKLRMKL